MPEFSERFADAAGDTIQYFVSDPKSKLKIYLNQNTPKLARINNRFVDRIFEDKIFTPPSIMVILFKLVMSGSCSNRIKKTGLTL